MNKFLKKYFFLKKMNKSGIIVVNSDDSITKMMKEYCNFDHLYYGIYFYKESTKKYQGVLFNFFSSEFFYFLPKIFNLDDLESLPFIKTIKYISSNNFYKDYVFMKSAENCIKMLLYENKYIKKNYGLSVINKIIQDSSDFDTEIGYYGDYFNEYFFAIESINQYSFLYFENMEFEFNFDYKKYEYVEKKYQNLDYNSIINERQYQLFLLNFNSMLFNDKNSFLELQNRLLINSKYNLYSKKNMEKLILEINEILISIQEQYNKKYIKSDTIYKLFKKMNELIEFYDESFLNNKKIKKYKEIFNHLSDDHITSDIFILKGDVLENNINTFTTDILKNILNYLNMIYNECENKTIILLQNKIIRELANRSKDE